MFVDLPFHLKDKIFEIKYNPNDVVSKITSYFPFSESEKSEITSILNNNIFDEFHSIFSNNVTDEKWNKSKDQIKKKFKDELFDIDHL